MQCQNIKFINLYIFVNIITHLCRDFIDLRVLLRKISLLKGKMRNKTGRNPILRRINIELQAVSGKDFRLLIN